MRKSFILFFILISFGAVAQDYDTLPLDTLLARLPGAKEDTNKVSLLYKIATLYDDSINEQGFRYCQDALALSQKLNWEKGMMYSKIYLGRIFWRKGKFSIALSFHNDAKLIAEKHGYKSLVTNLHEYIGQDYADSGVYDQAIKYFNFAKETYKADNNLGEVARCQTLLSWVYDTQGNYPESSRENLEALKNYEAVKDTYGIAISLANLASDNLKLQKYDEAIAYMHRSNEQYLIVGDYFNLSANFIALADANVGLKKYDEALTNAEKALDWGKKINDEISLGNAYSKIADIYFEQNNFAASARNLEMAVSYFRSANSTQLLANNYGSLSMSYLRMSNKDKARLALDSAKYFIHLNDALPGQAKYFNGRQLFDSLSGDWKNAYMHYYKYINIRDSIFNNDNTKKLMQNQMQYEYDKKEAEVKAEQEKKDIRQRNIRNSIGAGLAGALVFLVVVYRQRNKINKARKRSDELLLNILPGEVADELKHKGSAEARQFEQVTVMFTDFKGFTKISEKLSPTELVDEIHTCFKAFDGIIGKYNIEKIKTIGDSYMCAGGLPLANKTHAEDVVNAALEIQQFMQQHFHERKNSGKEIFELRIGINSGPVVAGIVGVKKFAYDIWGDTVNIASRMESSGETGKVNISGATYELVKNKFNCTYRGKISAKNKGEIDMYFVK